MLAQLQRKLLKLNGGFPAGRLREFIRRCSPAMGNVVNHDMIRYFAAASLALSLLLAHASAQTPVADDSEVRPPVTRADIAIVKRARAILDAPAKWNRADNRVCPASASTFSIYCALEKATDEVSGDFRHRGAAMQEARFVIDAIAPNRNYNHRLMDYNNDSTTTFANVRKVLDLLEADIAKRLAAETPK